MKNDGLLSLKALGPNFPRTLRWAHPNLYNPVLPWLAPAILELHLRAERNKVLVGGDNLIDSLTAMGDSALREPRFLCREDDLDLWRRWKDGLLGAWSAGPLVPCRVRLQVGRRLWSQDLAPNPTSRRLLLETALTLMDIPLDTARPLVGRVERDDVVGARPLHEVRPQSLLPRHPAWPALERFLNALTTSERGAPLVMADFAFTPVATTAHGRLAMKRRLKAELDGETSGAPS